jgi:hypothetical protein
MTATAVAEEPQSMQVDTYVPSSFKLGNGSGSVWGGEVECGLWGGKGCQERHGVRLFGNLSQIGTSWRWELYSPPNERVQAEYHEGIKDRQDYTMRLSSPGYSCGVPNVSINLASGPPVEQAPDTGKDWGTLSASGFSVSKFLEEPSCAITGEGWSWSFAASWFPMLGWAPTTNTTLSFGLLL